MKESLRAYIDLLRAHFAFAWPLLFLSGLALAFQHTGGFSWSLTLRAALIGLLGFEAGMVLNDYVDRERDRRDVEHDRLTRYWRPFHTRPIPAGLIPPERALQLFVLLATATVILIATLPYPNALYVLAIMAYSYMAECFYQVRKRDQRFPLAQLVGRTDFALFPVAGYLCAATPDTTALLYFLFFHPFTLAHLGVNDLIDIRNDVARGMKTVTVLYGTKGTAYWILSFSLLHAGAAFLFLPNLGPFAYAGIMAGLLLLVVANYRIARSQDPASGLAALPLFHIAMAIYAASIILDVVA